MADEQIGWAILELMGHVRVAGIVTEEERFGAKIGRIDIPTGPETFTTQFFGGGSVYRLTPVAEEIARAVTARNQPMPVQRWELPAPAQPAATESADDDPHIRASTAHTARDDDYDADIDDVPFV